MKVISKIDLRYASALLEQEDTGQFFLTLESDDGRGSSTPVAPTFAQAFVEQFGEKHNLKAEKLTAQGYRRIDHGMVSRIDRADWRDHMAQEHSPWDPEGEGAEWVRVLGKSAANQYRRVFSRDKIVVPATVAELVPTSDWDTTGFVVENKE